MKKWILYSLLLTLITILTACGSEEKAEGQSEPKDEKVFSAEDHKKAEEMLNYLDGKMEEFEKSTIDLMNNGELNGEDEEILNEEIQTVANETVIQPFLAKYEGSIIPEEYRGEEQITVYFNKTNSEPCSLGFCEYDGIEVMEIAIEFENSEEYSSEHFKGTELIFNDVQYGYQNDEKQPKETEIRFVKSADGKLIITQHPYLSLSSLNFKEYDQEFESLKTSVPESEVEAEQAEYKEEVEETLSKFPELQ
ncbi:hypothetical protein LG326_16950 (plasmid) [Metaplanococcus flavidus]